MRCLVVVFLNLLLVPTVSHAVTFFGLPELWALHLLVAPHQAFQANFQVSTPDKNEQFVVDPHVRTQTPRVKSDAELRQEKLNYFLTPSYNVDLAVKSARKVDRFNLQLTDEAVDSVFTQWQVWVKNLWERGVLTDEKYEQIRTVDQIRWQTKKIFYRWYWAMQFKDQKHLNMYFRAPDNRHSFWPFLDKPQVNYLEEFTRQYPLTIFQKDIDHLGSLEAQYKNLLDLNLLDEDFDPEIIQGYIESQSLLQIQQLDLEVEYINMGIASN